MKLRFNGGDFDFLELPQGQISELATRTDSRAVYETSTGAFIILSGSGFLEEGDEGFGTTGQVTSIVYKKGEDVVARFSDLDWTMNDTFSALGLLEEYDYSGINALLSSGPLEVSAVGASSSFDLGGYLVADNKVTFSGSSHPDRMYGGAGADKLLGRGGHDILSGYAGKDVLKGGGGDDRLFGGTENDKLFGEKGSDKLYGHGGDDLLVGSGGKDRLDGDYGNDTLKGGNGADRVYGGADDDEIDGNNGRDVLLGEEGNDIIRGGGGKDTILGGEGNDILGGNAGKDTIYGDSGNDFIVGGSGKDVLYGGSGADQFIFTHVKDSGKGKYADKIMDFEKGVDFLDFAALGAEFIGDAKFSGTGAEVQARNGDAGHTMIIVDADGDGTGDMRVDVLNVTDLTADSFVALDPA
ncbi:MAG: calcium-binding protein [Rhodobacteraceae bacterium]|nr:calcium-binding protein [Paracoccaceae bacterium]